MILLFIDVFDFSIDNVEAWKRDVCKAHSLQGVDAVLEVFRARTKFVDVVFDVVERDGFHTGESEVVGFVPPAFLHSYGEGACCLPFVGKDSSIWSITASVR